ncbi:CopG family transcriptional regulator [Candidatus Poribacteria bacterium]|nr:CopG family transcriptional regulator [Candidatus Poribacteria bacterium]
MSQQRIRTTIDIPLPLLKKADEAVGQKIAENRNNLILRALEDCLARWEQQKIDEHIAQMALDPEYQNIQRKMVEEYELAGWEALQIGEKQ